MRIVEKAADTAVDLSTDGDGDDSLSPIANYDDGGAGGVQGTGDVGPCPHRARQDPDDSAAPLFPPSRQGRSFPGTPMGLRETARYGLRAVCLGEASHPGPYDLGDREYYSRVAKVQRGWLTLTLLSSLCELNTYQILQAERFGFVGTHTPGVPARGAPPGPPPAAPRSWLGFAGYASPAHSVSSCGGGGQAVGSATRLLPASSLGCGARRALTLATDT